MPQKPALNFLAENWDVGIVGTSEAADLISVLRSTMQTRLNQGQADALYGPAGRVRRKVEMTGRHVVSNMLRDRFLRNGLSVDDATLISYVQKIRDSVIGGEQNTRAVISGRLRAGKTILDFHPDWPNGNTFDDSALLIPVGRLVARLATTLYFRLNEAEAMEIIAKAEAAR